MLFNWSRNGPQIFIKWKLLLLSQKITWHRPRLRVKLFVSWWSRIGQSWHSLYEVHLHWWKLEWFFKKILDYINFSIVLSKCNFTKKFKLTHTYYKHQENYIQLMIFENSTLPRSFRRKHVFESYKKTFDKGVSF